MAPPRILIVEDDPIITHLLSSMLQKRGYGVAGSVTSGEEAVLKAGELSPDLVIMDVTLSGTMDGIDAAHYIFQLFHCPLLFTTGISDEKRLELAKYSQPYGIIFKPFTPIEISTNVDLALYVHKTRPKGHAPYPAGDPKKLMEMLESIVIMDKRGRIIFFNPTASWCIDLPPKQILMKHWREVMMLINDKTEEQLKDPVAEAASHMSGVIYDAGTALVTTTSKRRKVKVNVRPVLDSSGKFLAVLMSIKEKTQTGGV
ncbi:MAG: response regulator [Methanoregula sp.]|jgi:CheY-like chemotaxis protein|uniref:response regulator n=1 Tax=Methanoregula sp. TaxID=2052170 RepID=UPI0025CFD915|nr:response regulator [Methanoregula sp.]MCK9631490.1 response regulator [Methanoregula sp.]